MKQQFVSVKDLCALWGFKRTKAFELLRLELIESVLLGRRRLISVASVEGYFQSLAANPRSKKGGAA